MVKDWSSVLLNIGERLREERVRLGYNQGDFAAIAGVAKTSQFNYEKGDRSPDATYLSAVAQKGVDVLYVVTGERRPEPAGSLSEDEARLVERYRLMSNEGRSTINSVSEALATFHK
ncbi:MULTISPECIES: helix-turn-helix domain-containing protein [Pseudomonas]|jgi:transcriptional regulator with XRE-family HTH domain|uniref:helix-turn-helix domain-containing protein n=1 Tax=Pseudomonas TaxID=286 RepID=UPI0018D8816F|nr:MULTISPECIES: helix-turn-helix transcriptional regulator [Pseudomonas]MBH3371907.1 helix-turn-helix transcriptional regulator [Pseudomonas juntendi]